MAEPLGIHEHGYTCREVVDLAAEYVEGTMSPEEATLFEMHLNFCDGCFTFIDQIRETAAIAGRINEEQVPEDTKVALLEAFRDWRRA
jgi:anti-sigma factor ChrR (cupin superfamily)